MICAAVEAVRQLYKGPTIKGFHLRNIRFLRTLEICPGADHTEMQLHLRTPNGDPSARITAFDFRIFTLLNDEWVECACGSIQVEPNVSNETSCGAITSLEAVPKQCWSQVESNALYERLAKYGNDCGFPFRLLRDIR